MKVAQCSLDIHIVFFQFFPGIRQNKRECDHWTAIYNMFANRNQLKWKHNIMNWHDREIDLIPNPNRNISDHLSWSPVKSNYFEHINRFLPSHFLFIGSQFFNLSTSNWSNVLLRKLHYNRMELIYLFIIVSCCSVSWETMGIHGRRLIRWQTHPSEQ